MGADCYLRRGDEGSKTAGCSLRQGAMHLKGTYKGDVFTYVLCVCVCLFLYLISLVSKLCFLSFSMQNHAESSRNFIKKSIFEHLLSHPDLPRKTSPSEQSSSLLVSFSGKYLPFSPTLPLPIKNCDFIGFSYWMHFYFGVRNTSA